MLSSDAAAFNSTRYALLERLKATGLPVEIASGGRTKFNRVKQQIPKTHWLDAACVGASTPEVLRWEAAKPIGVRLSKLLEETENKNWQDQHVIGPIFSPACYIEHSVLSVLFLLAKYRHDAERALIANAEVGGDNCHRGAILGALLGAAGGQGVFPDRWVEQLYEKEAILSEIEQFVGSLDLQED